MTLVRFLDLKILNGLAASLAGTSNPPHRDGSPTWGSRSSFDGLRNEAQCGSPRADRHPPPRIALGFIRATILRRRTDLAPLDRSMAWGGAQDQPCCSRWTGQHVVG